MSYFAKNIIEISKNRPEDCAIVDQKGTRKTTYKELINLAFQFANFIKENNISSRAVITLPRSMEYVVAIIGLNMANIPFAPMTDKDPSSRVDYVISQLEAELNINKDFLEKIKSCSTEYFEPIENDKDDMMYIYTSGSTGNPKGVVYDNNCIDKAIKRDISMYEMSSDAIFCGNASFNFSAIQVDLLAPISAGICYHIADDDIRKNYVELTKYINENKITHCFFPPQLLRNMNEDMPSLIRVVSGSEKISNIEPRNFEIMALYAMSESTVTVTKFLLDNKYDNTPIGKPFGDMNVYLLDENGNEAEEGEICISGPISKGYFNLPELTAKAFTENPFSKNDDDKVLLHTGDLGKRLEDGNILYLNRMDWMIKIDGQRVEPGEIEVVINALPQISQSVVKSFENEKKQTYLCAYYTKKEPIDETEIRRHIEKTLPPYMQPKFIIHMEELPVNNNGKLDRKSLKAPELKVFEREYEEPVGEIEQKICKEFEAIFEIDSVGRNEDFFELGGDSIVTTLLLSRLGYKKLNSTDILLGRTPQGIAEILKSAKNSIFENLPKAPKTAPLTESQMGIYVECMQMPQSTMYNIPMYYTFKKEYGFTSKQIKDAVNTALANHIAVFSHIENSENGANMVCEKIYDISEEIQCDESEIENIKSEFVKPFDLSISPLCKVLIAQTQENIYLFIDVHHIVFDGTSMYVLSKEISKILMGENIEKETFNPFNLYEIEKRTKESDKYKEDEEYFGNIFAGVEVDSTPIVDKKVTEELECYPAQKVIMDLDKTLSPELVEKFVHGEKVSESSFFMTAFGYMLAKITGQEESVFAVATSGRHEKILSNCASMLVKTLPVHMNIDEEINASTLIKNTQKEFYETLHHDSYSFGELVRNYGISTEVKFVYQASSLQGMEIGNVKIPMNIIPVKDAIGKFDFMIFKDVDKYKVQIDYRSDMYTSETIARILQTYKNILSSFINDFVLKEINLVSEHDVEIYDEFNATETQYYKDKTFVDALYENAKKFPEKVAVVYKEKEITYGELDEITDRIAEYVTNLGVKKEEIVSVLIKRNEFMPICSLGVLKSGAAYQPLDPTYPVDRLQFMVKDANAKLLIAEEDLLGLLPEYNGPVLKTSEIENLEKIDVKLDLPKPEDLFILLYTSGSTGVPKGCMLTHKNLTAFNYSHLTCAKIDTTSKVTAYASFGFDASAMDIFSTLRAGATMYIIPDEIRLDLDALADYYSENELTHVFMTTQVARQFIPYLTKTPTVQWIGTGGEALSTVKPEGNAKLFNLYGPTETICYVTNFNVDKLYENIPVGKPVSNVKIYVVDKYLRRMPIGMPGELLIAGDQVSRGYLGRPDKTNEVFVKNPFLENEEYNRVYRTGDIVRILSDGNVEFVGRRDAQVKIRGYRIELTEVEGIIKEYSGIKDVTVLAKDAPDGSKMLNAYIVSDETIDINALKDFILESKPAYIVPSAIMQIDEIPLTPNFKVDKRKLPEIVVKIEETEVKHSLTRIEQELFDIISKILGHTEFNETTNLELIGLTSISSMKLASEMLKAYGYSPNVKTLIKNQNILTLEEAVLEHLISNMKKGSEKTTEKAKKYPLSQSQLGIYLECFSAENMATYNIPVMIKLPKDINVAKLKKCVKTVIKAHQSMLCYIKADENGDPFMYPNSNIDFEIPEFTWNGKDYPEQTTFSFGDKPLFNVRLFKNGEEKHLLLEIHHIIGDGESVSILTKDINDVYNGEKIKEEQYTSFELAKAEREERKTKELDKAKEYYDSVFKGISVDVLPGRDISGEEKHEMKKISHKILNCEEEIEKYCKENIFTENEFFTSAFSVLLGKYSASDETLFNVIHNGRTDPRSFSTVGMFVKTMPVFSSIQNDVKIKDFISKTSTHLKKLKENDLYSYSEVSRAYGIKNDILFAYQGEILDNIDFCGSDLEIEEFPLTGMKAPLNIDVLKEKNSISLDIEYDAGMYSQEFMESFTKAYENCILNFTKVETIGDVTLVDEQDELKLKNIHDTSWNVGYKPVYRLMQDNAEKYPDEIAVIANGEKLTYKELNQKANQVAHILKETVDVNDIVSLILDRSKFVYIARQGILKSSGAFLSIDPTYPNDRVEYMIKDSNSKALIVTRDIYEEKKEFIDDLKIKIIIIDEISEDINCENLNLSVPENALAYCIYTSGSTGKPKGVMLTQKNLVNFVDNNPKNYETLGYIDFGKVSLALASITFDVSIMEEFIPLSHGLTICMANLEEIHNPLALRKLLMENNVDIMSCTPSFLLNILDIEQMQEPISKLKSIDLGAEAFPPAIYNKMQKINPELYIMNGYGPTEATISCTMSVIKKAEQITIGIPNANVKVAIVDDKNRILPFGALGEMVILGDGVGKGYVNRPDLTEKSFITFWDIPAYKSGDYARILPNGEIEFRGRLDNQVKLRGLRVELGEIETAINNFENVKSSLVLMKDSPSGQFLAAYFTASEQIDNDLLTEHLSESLTAYMVPSVLIQIDAFPLTANGKIDKTSLPNAEYTAKKVDYIAPTNEIEEQFCNEISKVLGVEKVGVNNNFFELGGTSLSASKIAMFALSKGYSLVYSDIFDNPTPREMAIICGADTKEEVVQSPVNVIEETQSVTDTALMHNSMEYIGGITKNSIGDLLLTGANGFLGIHILKKYLEEESGKVYCLIRKGNSSSVEKRLMNMLAYYFENPMEELFGERIICVEGSITDVKAVEDLKDIKFDTLINCAAIVKHFVYDDALTKTNVEGVKNLINLCKETNRRLIQVSTVSIAGEGVSGGVPRDKRIHENELFFGQILDNAYINSKFMAEEVVLDAIKDGLDAKIMRVGNLMPRENDGEFQINSRTNGFMRQLRGYKALGCFPVGAMSAPAEFSPIDSTAMSILLLSGTDKKYTVFHPYNNHFIYMADVIKAMVKHGLEIDIVSDEKFQEELMIGLGDEERNVGVSGLIAYMNNSKEEKYLIDGDNVFTSEALYRLGFAWPITGREYLERSLYILDNYGFFDYFI